MAAIFIADEKGETASLALSALLHQGHQLILAQDTAKAVELMRQYDLDLAILDLSGDAPSVGLLSLWLKEREPHPVPVLAVLERGVDWAAQLEGLLQLGTDDCLTKPFEAEELRWRVERLLDSLPVPPGTTQLAAGPLQLDLRNYQVSANGGSVGLTPVQFQLMRYLLSHAGEVFSSQALLQRVWGFPPGTGDPDLVRVHIRNLRRKLAAVTGGDPVVRTIYRHGYTIPETPSTERERPRRGQLARRNPLRFRRSGQQDFPPPEAA